MIYKSLTIGDTTNLDPVLKFISALFYVHIDGTVFIEVTDNKMLEDTFVWENQSSFSTHSHPKASPD